MEMLGYINTVIQAAWRDSLGLDEVYYVDVGLTDVLEDWSESEQRLVHSVPVLIQANTGSAI